MIVQALRMTQRDGRAGELHFLLLALIVAVAALSSVGFFIDRMRAGLNRDAHQLLGADLVIQADQPIQEAWRSQAARRGLRAAETVSFPSMAVAGEGDASRSQLVAVKAVTSGYPLRGKLKLAAPGAADVETREVPTPGTVWVDANVLLALNLEQGSQLRLGDQTFKVEQQIAVEPDRGASFINFAPRVMLAMSDLPKTGLIQAGSRVTYRLLLAGDEPEVSAYRAWIEQRIQSDNSRGVRLESLESGRPEMQATLDRAEQFLALVGLLSAMLAAVAIAMASRRFMLRHIDACAMLRCLGLRQNQVTALYLFEFSLLGLVGSLVGILLGYAAHFVLLEWLGTLVTTELPPASLWPAVQGVAVGLLLLLGFAIPPVLQLRNVPYTRVLRREPEAPRPFALATYGLGGAAFIGLLLWQSGDLRLAGMTAGGFLAGFAGFAAIAWLGLQSLRPMRSVVTAPAWRFALNGLQRRRSATVMQIVALALGLMALLLLTVIRGDLVEAWRRATPPDAPNRFVINIQPEQKEDIQARLQASGIADVVLYPMIRGRLTQVNGQAVNPESYAEGRARRLVDREFNLSTMRELPPQNEVVAGRWFSAAAQPEASVEAGLARTLGLKLGDVLRFDIGGEPVDATITSLRELDWGSMRVNFFVILSPEAVSGKPHTWITAFHLPASRGGLVNALTRDFPNLTVVDVGSMIKQVQNVLDQVITAVEFLFLFTLASGVLVLYAALLGSQDERVREAGLMRALGATRRQLARAQSIEFILVGALAGLLAASGAAVVGWALAEQVFNFDWRFKPTVWLAGSAAGVACAFAAGMLGLRSVLATPPLQTLRES